MVVPVPASTTEVYIYLLAGSREIDLGELEDNQVFPVSADSCRVAEGGGVVALRLVKRHVVWVDAADYEALAEAGCDARRVAVATVLYSVAVRVLASSAVYGEYQVVRRGRLY